MTAPDRAKSWGMFILAGLIAGCGLCAAAFALVSLPAPQDIPWALYRAGAALYALFGLRAAVAIWRHAEAAPAAFATWAIVAVVVCALPGLTMPEAAGAFRVVVVGGALAIGAACIPIHAYVRAAVSRAA